MEIFCHWLGLLVQEEISASIPSRLLTSRRLENDSTKRQTNEPWELAKWVFGLLTWFAPAARRPIEPKLKAQICSQKRVCKKGDEKRGKFSGLVRPFIIFYHTLIRLLQTDIDLARLSLFVGLAQFVMPTQLLLKLLANEQFRYCLFGAYIRSRLLWPLLAALPHPSRIPKQPDFGLTGASAPSRLLSLSPPFSISLHLPLPFPRAYASPDATKLYCSELKEGATMEARTHLRDMWRGL